MPFKLTFVQPEIALFYKGVVVYHTYVGNILTEGKSNHIFTLHPKDHDSKFTCVVNSNQLDKDPSVCLKELIDDGIETYAQFDTASPEYLIYKTYEALNAGDELLGKFYASMHRNFYHRKDSNTHNLAEEIMDDRYMSETLYQLGELYGVKDKSIEDILKFLGVNRIVHLLLVLYFDSGASVLDISSKYELAHYAKASLLIEAWHVLMQAIEKLAESTK